MVLLKLRIFNVVGVVRLILQNLLGLVNPLEQLRVIFSRRLKHSEVESLLALRDDVEGLARGAERLIVDRDLVVEQLGVHFQKLAPKSLVRFVTDPARVRDVKHPKRNLILFGVVAMVNFVLVDEVIRQLKGSLVRLLANDDEHALADETLSEEAQHRAEAGQVHALRDRVLMFLKSLCKLMEVLNAELKITVALLVPVLVR